MKFRIKFFLVLTVVLMIGTAYRVFYPPRMIPARTIGVVWMGHRASYQLPAEIVGSDILGGYLFLGWMLYVQGALPLCLFPWEKYRRFS